MNRKIIALSATLSIFPALLILFSSHVYSIPETPEGPQCGTIYTIIYKDPTKFDESKIINTLKENLSSVDFSVDVLGSNPWWEYLNISKPNNDGISSLSVPTLSLDATEIVKNTMNKMDGVLKVDSLITGWCT